MLNTLWLGFFVTSALAALVQWLAGGNAQVFFAMVEALFAMARLSVEVMLLLFGTSPSGFFCALPSALTWSKPGALAGTAVRTADARRARGHPALGLMTLNFAANALGLDNAATPIGLRPCIRCKA